MKEGFKLIGEHAEDCMVKDDVTFVILDRKFPYDFGRRINGARGGHTMWFRFACNDPDCEAVAMVRWDKMAEFVSGGLKDE